MKVKLLVLALVYLVTLLETEAKLGKCCLSEKFDWNGRACQWKENRRAGNNRGLSVKCKKDGNLEALQFMYKGYPHPCRWYNKHQREYYECPMKVQTENGHSLCGQITINCDRECTDIVLTKQ